MSLAAYAPARGCFVCGLPERAEIDAVRRTHKIGPDRVVAWLIAEKGYPDDIRARARSSLNYHFQQRHHESR